MRPLLFAVLAACSLTATAAENWKPYPYDQSAFDYSGDKLREAWPRLTRGFGANYPFPDADWVVTKAVENPKALEMTVGAGLGFSGKPEEAGPYAERLQDVWRSVFRGDFAKAKEDGLKLGVGGQVPAMFGQVLYAMFIETDQAQKHQLLEEVVERSNAAGELNNADIVAQFGRIYAMARLAEELPIPVVLKRGYTGTIPKELDALLTQQPEQPFALALYGGYEAGIIRKVGKLVGRMTYGVSPDKMENYFGRSLKAQGDLPITHYEYANALGYVYGDDQRSKSLEQLQKAASFKPVSAMEALEVAHAQTLLKKAK